MPGWIVCNFKPFVLFLFTMKKQFSQIWCHGSQDYTEMYYLMEIISDIQRISRVLPKLQSKCLRTNLIDFFVLFVIDVLSGI